MLGGTVVRKALKRHRQARRAACAHRHLSLQPHGAAASPDAAASPLSDDEERPEEHDHSHHHDSQGHVLDTVPEPLSLVVGLAWACHTEILAGFPADT